MVKIYTEQDFEGLRKAGKLASQVLDYITDFVNEGVSTLKLNDLCHEFIIKNKAIPAPLNYKGFPKSICTSVNHVVCHGIPNETKILKNGDIINLDITVILNGYYGDTSRMFMIGNVNIKAKRLVEVAKNALFIGIDQAKISGHLGDIGYYIQNYVEKEGFSVVREYCGHGIGKSFHEDPQVPHYGKKNSDLLIQEGMVFTIEPMINVGDWPTIVSKIDGWTVTTKDKSLSAQWEHTLGITKNGPEIFTL